MESLTSVIIQVALGDRPEATPAPSAEDMLPDVSLVSIILDAIASCIGSGIEMAQRAYPVPGFLSRLQVNLSRTCSSSSSFLPGKRVIVFPLRGQRSVVFGRAVAELHCLHV